MSLFKKTPKPDSAAPVAMRSYFPLRNLMAAGALSAVSALSIARPPAARAAEPLDSTKAPIVVVDTVRTIEVPPLDIFLNAPNPDSLKSKTGLTADSSGSRTAPPHTGYSIPLRDIGVSSRPDTSVPANSAPSESTATANPTSPASKPPEVPSSVFSVPTSHPSEPPAPLPVPLPVSLLRESILSSIRSESRPSIPLGHTAYAFFDRPGVADYVSPFLAYAFQSPLASKAFHDPAAALQAVRAHDERALYLQQSDSASAAVLLSWLGTWMAEAGTRPSYEAKTHVEFLQGAAEFGAGLCATGIPVRYYYFTPDGRIATLDAMELIYGVQAQAALNRADSSVWRATGRLSYYNFNSWPTDRYRSMNPGAASLELREENSPRLVSVSSLGASIQNGRPPRYWAAIGIGNHLVRAIAEVRQAGGVWDVWPAGMLGLETESFVLSASGAASYSSRDYHALLTASVRLTPALALQAQGDAERTGELGSFIWSFGLSYRP